MTDNAIELTQVVKSYGSVRAVDDVSLGVRTGEFFSLLGPSGCGKTTTLRLMAGLEQPDGGDIRLMGERVNGRPPYERPVSMVFQHYALFPHLDVEQNVTFGLIERRVPDPEMKSRATRALDMVRLHAGTFARRRPTQLSGGQRQRVALARALVLEPKILLLDEPLGALDLQLRKEMQLELRALNRALGTTFVFVTHDQEEALVMSDRIAVMDGGKVAQVGTPAEIYERPRTAFVARFIGACNVLAAGGRQLAVRPERLRIFAPGTAPAGQQVLPGTVREVLYHGDTHRVVVRLADETDATVAIANTGQALPWKPGEAVVITWHADAETVLAS